MIDQIRILDARRAYEFHPDDLRLTMFTLEDVRLRIKRMFSFHVAEIGRPIPSFGPVLKTIPPGVVFNFGAAVPDGGSTTPIRYLHFEPARIVVDVAGPSSAIDFVVKQLIDAVADLRAPDGAPVIGQPARVRDYSEIVAHFDFPPSALLAPALSDVFHRAATSAGKDFVAPSVIIATDLREGKYAGTPRPGPDAFNFELRMGEDPGARIYFSGAPLATDAHVTYLRELEASVTGGSQRNRRSDEMTARGGKAAG